MSTPSIVQFFSNMDNLFDHPGFCLIYVDELGGMSLILPLLHEEDIIEKGYRCISHLWENATRWDDHPVQNVTWGVDVREEKREKLLQILRHYGGYWWIDVFCTDQDSYNKPLSIMGDVYRNCKECICMLDIKQSDITRLFIGLSESGTLKMVLKCMNEIMECKWNKRVWTLQEWVLPPIILYTTETIEEVFHIASPNTLLDILVKIHDDADDIATNIIVIKNIPRIAYIRDMFERNSEDVISHLISSERKCKDHKDYYYGIAGILDISLTDGSTFEEVEKEFFTQWNKTAGIPLKRKGLNGEESLYRQWTTEKLIDRPMIHLYRMLC